MHQTNLINKLMYTVPNTHIKLEIINREGVLIMLAANCVYMMDVWPTNVCSAGKKSGPSKGQRADVTAPGWLSSVQTSNVTNPSYLHFSIAFSYFSSALNM